MSPKLTVDTRTDIKSEPSAALGTFDIKCKDTVKGWKLEAVLQPKLGKLNKSGFGGIQGANLDLIADNGDVFVYFDNVDLIPEGKWAPRVSLKKKLDVSGKKYDTEVTYARKGNTSVLPNREPLATDILKLSVKAPAMSGVTPKLEYGTLTKTAVCTLSGKVEKCDLSLKTQYKINGGKLDYTATAAMPLADGFKASAEAKLPSKSGKVALSKGQYTVELPIKSFDKTPDPMSAVLKIKYSRDFEL